MYLNQKEPTKSAHQDIRRLLNKIVEVVGMESPTSMLFDERKMINIFEMLKEMNEKKSNEAFKDGNLDDGASSIICIDID